jgi:hypothetical protein
MGLRIRRADAAPGVGLDEYFGRLGESVITDRGCSDEAKVLLAAVYLDMATSNNRVLSMATNEDLAGLTGKSPRTITRRLAELEARGHLARERIRSIAGSPRGLRPLGRLRGVRRPSDTSPVTRCNPSPVSMHLDTADHAPRQDWPGDPTPMTTPPKREEDRGLEQQQGAASAADVDAPFAPQGGTADAPGRADFLRSLALDLAGALDLGAREGPGGPSAKSTTGAESRESIPDVAKSTTCGQTKSMGETEKNHKNG